MRHGEFFISVLASGAILVLIGVFFGNSTFFDWAFERHGNPASWIIRPLLLLPFCWFAWKRSPAGMLCSVLAILTSMFWFPPPNTLRSDIRLFLEMERMVLSGGWTWQLFAGLVAIVAYGSCLAAAFWQRSWKMGLAVAGVGALGKVIWSLAASPEAGAAVVPYAVGGLLALVTAMVLTLGRGRSG